MKSVFSLRLEEEDIEFLRSLPNASEFIRQSITEEKRKHRTLDSKGLPFEIIHEIAEAFTKWTIENFRNDDWDLETQTSHLSTPLFNISALTLTCQNPYIQNESIVIPSLEPDHLEVQSAEAKAFIQKLNSKIETNGFDYCGAKIKEPLNEDELETVRKIYDEAKMLLEQGYRKVFHKLPTADWHLTIYDGRNGNEGRLRYQLP